VFAAHPETRFMIRLAWIPLKTPPGLFSTLPYQRRDLFGDRMRNLHLPKAADNLFGHFRHASARLPLPSPASSASRKIVLQATFGVEDCAKDVAERLVSQRYGSSASSKRCA
jgi:hypothetical protein